MNLFRSEEHLRRWEGYAKAGENGTIPLAQLMRVFSSGFAKNRRDPDYLSHMGQYVAEMLPMLDTLEDAGRNWRMTWYEKVAFSVAQRLGLA